jgi:hypothetical protein
MTFNLHRPPQAGTIPSILPWGQVVGSYVPDSEREA